MLCFKKCVNFSAFWLILFLDANFALYCIQRLVGCCTNFSCYSRLFFPINRRHPSCFCFGAFNKLKKSSLKMKRYISASLNLMRNYNYINSKLCRTFLLPVTIIFRDFVSLSYIVINMAHVINE